MISFANDVQDHFIKVLISSHIISNRLRHQHLPVTSLEDILAGRTNEHWSSHISDPTKHPNITTGTSVPAWLITQMTLA